MHAKTVAREVRWVCKKKSKELGKKTCKRNSVEKGKNVCKEGNKNWARENARKLARN